MLDLTQITERQLQREPYAWAEIGNLFSPADAEALASSFPSSRFKTVVGDDGEKDYEYEARVLIAMGASAISNPKELSPEWMSLTNDLLSVDYRNAMSLLTGRDLSSVPIEVNVFHYGPGARLGPHADLKDKIVTHVLYFNRDWNRDDGGCLSVLRSKDPNDVAARIAPTVGNSVVLVRSDNSWHAVSRVVAGCNLSRRSMTVTFYEPGSISTMWPPGDRTPLHRYNSPDLKRERSQFGDLWSRLRDLFQR